MILSRRNFLVGTAALAAGASVSVPFFLPKYHSGRRAKRSRVAILNVDQYSQRIDEVIASGLRLVSEVDFQKESDRLSAYQKPLTSGGFISSSAVPSWYGRVNSCCETVDPGVETGERGGIGFA